MPLCQSAPPLWIQRFAASGPTTLRANLDRKPHKLPSLNSGKHTGVIQAVANTLPVVRRFWLGDVKNDSVSWQDHQGRL